MSNCPPRPSARCATGVSRPSPASAGVLPPATGLARGRDSRLPLIVPAVRFASGQACASNACDPARHPGQVDAGDVGAAGIAVQRQVSLATREHDVGGRRGQVHTELQRVASSTADLAFAAPFHLASPTLQRTAPGEVIETVAEVRRPHPSRAEGQLPGFRIGGHSRRTLTCSRLATGGQSCRSRAEVLAWEGVLVASRPAIISRSPAEQRQRR